MTDNKKKYGWRSRKLEKHWAEMAKWRFGSRDGRPLEPLVFQTPSGIEVTVSVVSEDPSGPGATFTEIDDFVPVGEITGDPQRGRVSNTILDEDVARMSDNVETFERWLSDDDTWIGVFENADLGHSAVGQRIAMSFSLSDGSIDKAEIDKTKAPDSPATGGIGWRYILKAKARTVREAIWALTSTPEGPYTPGATEDAKKD